MKRVLVFGMLAAACTQTPAATTTSAPSTTTNEPPSVVTSTTTTTSTTAPATTTTVTQLPAYTDLETVEFPQVPKTVEDLPSEIVRLIDAPVPDPDLTLTGPDDIERWLVQWLHWAAWVQANPEPGMDSLELGLLSDTEMIIQWRAALEGRVQRGERFLGYPFIPTEILLTTFDEDFTEGKVFTLVVTATNPHPGYTIDSRGTVIDVLAAQDFTVPLELTLRPDGGGEWVVSALTPLSG